MAKGKISESENTKMASRNPGNNLQWHVSITLDLNSLQNQLINEKLIIVGLLFHVYMKKVTSNTMYNFILI